MTGDYLCWNGPVANSDLPNIPLTTAGIGAFAAIASPANNATITTITPTITGSATPGEVVTIALQSPAHSGTATADSTGQWTFSIPSAWGLQFGETNKIITANIIGGGTGGSVSLSIACPSGYQLPSGQATASACENINECTAGTHTCGALVCTDTIGSFICGCSGGQTFNGSSCVSGSIIFTTPGSWGTTFNSTTPVLAGRFNTSDVDTNQIYVEKKSNQEVISIAGNPTPLDILQVSPNDNPSWSPAMSPDPASKVGDTWSFTVPGSWGLLYGASYLVGVGFGNNNTTQAVKINIDCSAGFEPANHPTPSISCVDINECSNNTHTCHPTLEICTNLVGSFSCSCIANHSLINGTCTPNPTYSLSISSSTSSPTNDVTPTLSGTISRSDGSTTSPLAGIPITMTDGTNSTTFTTTTGGAWTITVPAEWGWQIGQGKTVTLTLWSDSYIHNFTLACGTGYQPTSDHLACELIPPSPTPAPSPAPSPTPAPSPAPSPTPAPSPIPSPSSTSTATSTSTGSGASTGTGTSTRVEKASAQSDIYLSIDRPRRGEIFKTPTPTLSGTAQPGYVVTVSIEGKSSQITVDASGTWTFTVPSTWDLRKGPHTLVVSDSSGASATVEWETTCADGQVYNVAGQCFKDEYILQGSGSQNLRVCGITGRDRASDSDNFPRLGLIILYLLPLIFSIGSNFRRILIGMFLWMMIAPPARAINVQIFKPIPDNNGLIGVTGTSPMESGTCWLGSYLNKDVSPIELATPLGVRVSDVISELYSLDVSPTCGIGSDLSLTASAPFHWVKQRGEFSTSGKVKYEGVGDADLMLRWTVRDGKAKSGLGLALTPYMTIPGRKKMNVLGAEMNLLGESHVTGGLQGNADITLGARHYFASTLGYHHRPTEDFLNIRLEPEWRMAAGYGYLVGPNSNTQLTLEWHRREPIGRLRKDRFTAPTELFAGLSSQFISKSSRFFAGGSAGLSTGYGAPAYRLYSGLEIKLERPVRETLDSNRRSILPAIDVRVKDDSGSPLVVDRVIARNLEQAGRFTAEQQTSHASLGPLALGLHKLTIEKNGFKSEHLGVAIHSLGDHPKVAVTLMPLGGQLDVTVKTKQALSSSPMNFHITDNMRERNGLLDEETRSFANIPPGIHTFKITSQDAVDVSQRFIVTASSATLMTIDLRGANGLKSRTILDFGDIIFDTNKSLITPESMPVLERVVATLKEHPMILKVAIEGYTDNQGHRVSNLSLSKRRAAAVRAYLIDHGIESDRLSADGFGQESPVESNETPSGRRANRRVEFVVHELGTQPL